MKLDCSILIKYFRAIGIYATDLEEDKLAKRLLVLLALLMSIGGVVWGSLLYYFGLYVQAVIPYAYVVLSVANIGYFAIAKNYRVSNTVQIFLSMVLPFLLQWLLGGFFASGAVMLWSSLALIGSITLLRGKMVLPWLLLYLGLTLFSYYIDDVALRQKPEVLTDQISLSMLVINLTMIITIVFVLAKAKVDRDVSIARELKSAKETAEESNRLKTIFLGNLSHEVRTPLQGIQGIAELLESPLLSEAKRTSYLAIVRRRTTDLQNIIESLLDLASLETGEIKTYPTLFSLHQHIESVFHSLHPEIAAVNKHISFRLQSELNSDMRAFIDPQHLTQVIINLVGNARKFTKSGTITLSAKRGVNNYLVSVADTGIGISAEKIDSIFEPFRQAHEGLSRSQGGIGLGLAICMRFVEMWGGGISVTSQLGRGSTFTLTIPIPNE